MMTALTRLSGSAFELTITVPWADIKKIYDEVFDELSSQIEVEGFRKGKAPKNVVEGKIDKNKIYGEVINRLVPQSYQKALEEHGLKPVINPQVKITTAEEEKDWQLIVTSAEKPQVTLGDYKKEISAVNATGKIWKPGEDEKAKQDDEKKKISTIIDKLLAVAVVELPQIMVDMEANRLLTALLEDVRAAGLTYEQYLQSSAQTAESVKAKYKSQAVTALKLEFILEAVADDLKIEVSADEIKAVVEKEKIPESQSYVLASVMRRDKTISKLLTI